MPFGILNINSFGCLCFAWVVTCITCSIASVFLFRATKKIITRHFGEQTDLNIEPAFKGSFIIAFGISWCFAFLLGCIFAGWPFMVIDRDISFVQSLNWIVLVMFPFGLVVVTFSALLLTPIARWSFRTGKNNLFLYGSILWLVLATFIFLSQMVTKFDGRLALFGSLFLSVFGLSVIGLIPPKSKKLR